MRRSGLVAVLLLTATPLAFADGDASRGEKRFDSVDDLVAQMRRDVEEARQIASATVPPP